LYLAAFGAGVVAGTWTPNHDLLTTGGRGALTQATFGMLANGVGEFWPEIERVWKRKKKPAATTPGKSLTTRDVHPVHRLTNTERGGAESRKNAEKQHVEQTVEPPDI
jgi:hypothetical protein